VAHSGKDHPLAAAGLGNLGILDYILGRYARAEQRLEQAADIRNEGLAAQPLGRAVGLSALGVIHVAKCEYDEARKFLEQARALADQELAEKGQSAEHRSVVAVVDTLGVLCLAQARYQQADAHLMRALTVAKRVWGEQHPYAAGILNDIAELRLCQTRYDEAIETAGKAAELYKRAFPDLGENHVGAAAAKAICGRAEIGRGRAPEARKLLAPVLDVQQRSFGREHPAIARTMGDLASLDSSTNTYDRGVGQFGRAIKMAEGILGREHPEVAHLLFGLAALHIARDKFAAAEPLLKEAAAIQEKTLVANHPDLAATLELHAEALRRQSPPQTEQAAALAARAQAIRQKHAAADRPE
jgi:tetratricopeptide (TPR) repeat protein